MDELKAVHLNSFHFKEDNAPVQQEPIGTSPQFVVDKPMSYEPEELVLDVVCLLHNYSEGSSEGSSAGDH
jgi:hypothetical protein